MLHDLRHAEKNVAKYELILDMKETEVQQKTTQIEGLRKDLQTLKENTKELTKLREENLRLYIAYSLLIVLA